MGGRKSAYETLWRQGELWWMLAPHQLQEYRRFRAWNALRQTKERIEYELAQGWSFNNIWMCEWGRRAGKSSLTLVIMMEEAIRFYNRTGEQYRGLMVTTKEKYITGIYKPLMAKIFNQQNCGIPDDLVPQYRGSKDGFHKGFHIPGAGDAYIKLVGLDLNPDATRGEWTDGCFITEAALTRTEQLEDAVVGVIQPQTQNRPHAFIFLESSSPKVPDHSFAKVFRPDCMVRGAYSKLTIEDNSLLSKEEIELTLAKSGGRNAPKVRREYFCEEVRDSSTLVIPDYNDLKHRKLPSQVPVPRYAQAFTAMDPGFKDMCGIVFFHVSNGQIVVEASIGERQLGIDDIAEKVKTTEDRLWGSGGAKLPDAPESGLLADLFKDERTKAKPTGDLIDPLTPPTSKLSYWSQEQYEFQLNPAKRITDHMPLLVDALHKHGLHFDNAKKGPDSKEDNLQRLNSRFRNDEIVILDNGQNDILIASLRSGEWDEDRKKFKKTPQLGNLDLISALAYGTRDINLHYDPNPPTVINPWAQNIRIPASKHKELKRKWEAKHPLVRDQKGRFTKSSLSLDTKAKGRDIF